MVMLATLMWLFSGIISFFVNLGRILKLAEEAFWATEVFFKWVFYVIMFIIHVSGGLISLVYAIYEKFRSN